MPYDPLDDADALRLALKELRARERLSRKAIIQMFEQAYKARKTQFPQEDKMNFSEASLERFENGIAVGKSRELRFLWELLEQHPVYRKYLCNGKPLAAPTAIDFGAALAAFFTDPSTEAKLATARINFPGEYVMIRRDYDVRDALPGGVRVSRMRITATPASLLVEERQDYQQRDDVAGHRQHDTGYLFAYGRYLQFLLKDLSGSAVKLGVIKYHEPERDTAVRFFEGVLYVASNRATFPRARFFCRRVGPNGDALPPGYAKLEDITDTVGKNYIAKDFKQE